MRLLGGVALFTAMLIALILTMFCMIAESGRPSYYQINAHKGKFVVSDPDKGEIEIEYGEAVDNRLPK